VNNQARDGGRTATQATLRWAQAEREHRDPRASPARRPRRRWATLRKL